MDWIKRLKDGLKDGLRRATSLSIIQLSLIAGATYLISGGYEGWGWMLFILWWTL